MPPHRLPRLMLVGALFAAAILAVSGAAGVSAANAQAPAPAASEREGATAIDAAASAAALPPMSICRRFESPGCEIAFMFIQ